MAAQKNAFHTAVLGRQNQPVAVGCLYLFVLGAVFARPFAGDLLKYRGKMTAGTELKPIRNLRNGVVGCGQILLCLLHPDELDVSADGYPHFMAELS